MNRILRGIGANAFGQAVTVLTQLLSVPLFLSAWGAERYGIWIMLITVPVYLGLLDFGFTGVAANRINMLVAGGRQRDALVCFQSTLGLVLVFAVVFTLPAIALTGLFADEVGRWTGTTPGESMTGMLMIAIQVFGYMVALLSYGVFWSGGRYAEATMWHNAFRLLEFLLLAGGVLFLDGGFLLLLTLLAVSRLLLLVVLYVRMRALAPWAEFGLRLFSLAELKSMRGAAIAFNAFPIGNALNMQGMTLVAGLVFGPTFVAFFNAMRTLSRIPFQLGQLISQALSPEIGRLYGERNATALRALYRNAMAASVALASACGGVLYVLGDWICQHWTHGKLHLLYPDYTLLLTAAVVNSLWTTASVMVTSTNNHGRLAGIFMCANAAGLALAAGGGAVFGETAVALGVLVTEAVVLAVLLPQVRGFARHGMPGELAKS
ncbi:lipopolysaccharide biosynthesis protein [Paracidovorax citrulli]